MPRSNRPRRGRKNEEAETESIDLDRVRLSLPRTVIKRGVEYTVQTSIGANADEDKTWTCPHCNLVITRGVNHTVAWDTVRGAETRRHFHNHCWSAFQGPLL